MRMLCDVCDSVPGILFCAADNATLCRSCDDKVHMCNKLASQHVRVGLADPIDVPCCDICEAAPDGSALCLQCDMTVHVGGKRTHVRYLLLRQRVEFPGDKCERAEGPTLQPLDPGDNRIEKNQLPKPTIGTNQQNHMVSAVQMPYGHADGLAKMNSEMIELNMKPNLIHGQSSNQHDLSAKKFEK